MNPFNMRKACRYARKYLETDNQKYLDIVCDCVTAEYRSKGKTPRLMRRVLTVPLLFYYLEYIEAAIDNPDLWVKLTEVPQISTIIKS